MKLFRRNVLAVVLSIAAATHGSTGVVRAQGAVLNTEDVKAELVVQTGHTSRVGSISYSDDGRLIATASQDSTVKIWDVASGRELRTLVGHERTVNEVVFTPGGRRLVTASTDGTVRLWDVRSGRQIASTTQEMLSHSVNAIAVNPDGSLVASSELSRVDGEGGRIVIRDAANLQEIRSIPWKSFSAQVAFSPDGKILAASERQEVVKLYNARTGVELKTLSGPVYSQFKHNTNDITFSRDGRTIATAGSDDIARIWDVESGKEQRSFRGHKNSVTSVTFAFDGKRLVTSGFDKAVIFWDIEKETEIERRTMEQPVGEAALSHDGHQLAVGIGPQIHLWNVATGTLEKKLGGNVLGLSSGGLDSPILVSPTGRHLATRDLGKVALWSLAGNSGARILGGDFGDVQSWAFSPDGKILATGGGFASGKIKLWDVETATELRSLAGHERTVSDLAFTPDGKRLISAGSEDQTIKLWQVSSGELMRSTKAGDGAQVFSTSLGQDGRTILISTRDGISLQDLETGSVQQVLAGANHLVRPSKSSDGFFLAGQQTFPDRLFVWDIRTGEKTHDLENTFANREAIRKIVPSIVFNNEVAFGKLVAGTAENRKVKIFDRASHSELATLVAFSDGEWAVVTPEGLFDASADARRRMHYAVGLEAVTLDQMKDVYYVPGLVRKITAGDSLPKIGLFSAKDLFPHVEFAPPKYGDATLPVRITNRGGGIGQVQVLVNGKEFVRDARPSGLDPNIQHTELTISLKDAPLATTGENRIEIVARNASGSLTNRGTRGMAERFSNEKPASKRDPQIYLIAGGISQYAAENLNLNFAAKDAADFAKAVDVGAVKLLKGDRSKVHIRLLTNGSASAPNFKSADAKVSTATKADFERAFADFKNATADDVFIVYLAGHGTSIGQGGTAAGNSYLYLTQEATTTDRSVLAVENARRAMTVSSDELKEMMKQNKALKQVLILDTCAAGAASGSFVAKRDVPADQIGALERLKDNTGFYILMGSAADAVSYEASQYGQGLLTYSLLQGMKGARLRDDQFADVEMLFGYAKETVGRLAKHVGGIQRPETITPDSSRSFDIGEFTPAERSQINTIAQPVPLLLRPRLTNSKLRYDNLGLERVLRAELRRQSLVTGGAVPKLMFVESDDMPDAFLPSGDYAVDGEKITMTVVLVRNEQPVGNEIVVSGTINEKEELIRQLIDRIAQASGRPSI